MSQQKLHHPLIIFSLLMVLLLSGSLVLDRASANTDTISASSPDTADGPDLFGYTFLDSLEPGGPLYTWEDISASGKLIDTWSNLDDGYAGALPIGFTFNYYGSEYTEFYVSTNGYLSFGQGWGTIPGNTPPQTDEPNNDIALFGGDLWMEDYGVESRVYYQTLSNPTRLVVQFVNIHDCCEFNTPRTFEVILYADGDILSQYSALNGTSSDYVGIENIDGTDGLGYGAVLNNGLAIRYVYPTGVFLLPDPQQGYGTPGETVAYTLQLTNHTGSNERFDLSVLPGNVYTTTLSTDRVGPIANGTTITFTAWVEIPAAALPGDSDSAIIEAASFSDPTVTETATLNTQVIGQDTAYVTLEDSNLIAVVDVATQMVIDTIDTFEDGCYSPWRATLSPSGSHVYVGCYASGSVLVIDTATNDIVTHITGIPSADDVAFTHHGEYALVGSRWQSQIAVIDTATFQLKPFITTPGYARSLVMHPYLEIAYATSDSGEILVIDTGTLSIVDSITVGGTPWDVAVSADGNWVYSGDRYGSGLWVIDANTNTLADTVTGFGELTGLEVSRDGAYIYAGGLYNEVWIIDGNTLMPVTSVTVNGYAWEVALTCDETQLYVGNTLNEVAVIDALSFNLSGTIPLPGDTSRGIAICPEFISDGVMLDPETQTSQGTRSEVVEHVVTLVNATGQTDSFTLDIAGNTWTTNLSTALIGPIAHGASAAFSIFVTVPADAAWYASDTVVVTADSLANPGFFTDTAQATTVAYAPPHISVDPLALSSTQFVDTVITQTMTISNGDGVPLTFKINTGNSQGAPLELVMDVLNMNYLSITNLIPNRFDFDEGDVGCAIDNGTNDMYDVGNYLGTNLGGYICYSDDTIIPSGYLGASGRYFTRKLPGLFVMAADIENVNAFEITGDLGADGSGSADGTVLQTEVGGVTYYGFVKRVSGTSDPSVNHLIIVPQNALAGHNFALNTNDDFHQVYNLGTNTRLYYLLYAGADGFYIDDAATLGIMQAFLQLPGLTGSTPWLSVTPVSGELLDNTSLDVQVATDATGMQPGTYLSGLTVSSNDPLQPYVSVPVTMTVELTADMGQISGSVSDAWSGAPLTATVELDGVYSMLATPDYSMWAHAGSYSLTAYATGYYTATLPVEIVAGQMTMQDIALEPALPRLGTLPGAISMTLAQGNSGTQALTLTNNGPMPLDFALFEINPLANINSVQGLGEVKILYDRSHCQVDLASYYSLKTELVNAGATITENLLGFNETTLVGYDVLWLNDGTCAWTFTELELLNQWLDAGGAVLIQSASTPAATGPASIFGINYAVFACASGVTTNILAHPISEGVKEYYMDSTCSYVTGSPVEVILDPLSSLPHVIAAEQGKGKMVVVAGDDFVDAFISNNDNRLLAMNTFEWLATPVYSEIPWLAETPAQGSVPGKSSLSVSLEFDAAGLTPGVYEAILAVEHNDPAKFSPAEIPVTLNVTGLQPALAITPVATGLSGFPGETVVYTFTLTNLGNAADSFTLEVSNMWTTALSAASTDVLLSGESFIFTASVTVPLAAQPGDQDVAVVTGTSNLDASVSDTAQATTTAVLSPVEFFLNYLSMVFKN